MKIAVMSANVPAMVIPIRRKGSETIQTIG